jgi:hypothetical protein
VPPLLIKWKASNHCAPRFIGVGAQFFLYSCHSHTQLLRRRMRAIPVGAIPRAPTWLAPRHRKVTTNAYRLARVSGGWAVRAEALRASRLYPVNYKIVPPGTKDSKKRRNDIPGVQPPRAIICTPLCGFLCASRERQRRDISRMAAKIW